MQSLVVHVMCRTVAWRCSLLQLHTWAIETVRLLWHVVRGFFSGELAARDHDPEAVRVGQMFSALFRRVYACSQLFSALIVKEELR